MNKTVDSCLMGVLGTQIMAFVVAWCHRMFEWDSNALTSWKQIYPWQIYTINKQKMRMENETRRKPCVCVFSFRFENCTTYIRPDAISVRHSFVIRMDRTESSRVYRFVFIYSFSVWILYLGTVVKLLGNMAMATHYTFKLAALRG